MHLIIMVRQPCFLKLLAAPATRINRDELNQGNHHPNSLHLAPLIHHPIRDFLAYRLRPSSCVFRYHLLQIWLDIQVLDEPVPLELSCGIWLL